MNNDLLTYLLNGAVATNIGPDAKEILLEQAETEYDNGNFLHSIFFQVRSLFQALQERYFQIDANAPAAENSTVNTEQLLQQMNEWEKENLKSNPLMQYVVATLKESAITNNKSSATKINSDLELKSCNFLQNILDPLVGVQKIQEICAQLPEEWTILQLCKGPRTETTYSMFSQIHEHEANIYLTLVKHARSAQYPEPLCLRFCGDEQCQLFKKFASIANRFKQSVSVDPKLYNTKESKKIYWDVLEELNQYIGSTLLDLKTFFFPWNFLFTGRPLHVLEGSAGVATGISIGEYQSKAFCSVDTLCNEYQWAANERVLLSLAALHVNLLTEAEICAISKILSTNERAQAAAIKLLLKLQTETPVLRANEIYEDTSTPYMSKNYPCILVIDERLDHFFWEELNVQQEFCRVNSLQCLWRLFQLYKANIRNGYLNVNINDGGCLVNPDSNLPKMELRMKSFFQYWTPHWLMKFSEKPTQEELLKDFFKRTCYVYAGHGSGLQYINGKHIAKQQMNCVVFLFGCDSSRLHSNGLYSELVGPHLYYHAAMCPTLVGTLMAGLDSFMDGIATAILSRWIAPKSKQALVWQEIDRISWVKEGLIKPKLSSSASTKATIANTPNYHMGSLCAILARVHQRKVDAKYYNTVPYVCRGLPAWNCNVQELPETTL